MHLDQRENFFNCVRKYGYVSLLSFIALSLAIGLSNNLVRADNINPGVHGINSEPYGIPYKDWTAKFWQWDFSLSKSQHPRESFTPEKCANGQNGPVWFLGESLGGTQERTCTIPADKSIFASVIPGECDLSDPTLHNDQDVRQCATEGNDYSAVSATVDGVPIKNLDRYRVDSGYFNLVVAKDNIFNEPAGTYRAFANGIYLFLEPLHVGKHELHFKVSVQNPVKPQYNYAADWTYHLTVQ